MPSPRPTPSGHSSIDASQETGVLDGPGNACLDDPTVMTNDSTTYTAFAAFDDEAWFTGPCQRSSSHGGMHEIDDHEPFGPAVWRGDGVRRLLATEHESTASENQTSPTPSTCDTTSDTGMPGGGEHLPADQAMWNAGELRTLIECPDVFALHESILAPGQHAMRRHHVGTPRRCHSADPCLQTPRLPTPEPRHTMDHEAEADELLARLNALNARLQQQTHGSIEALCVEQDGLSETLRYCEERIAELDELADAYIATMMTPRPEAENDTWPLQEDEHPSSQAPHGTGEEDWEVMNSSLPSMRNGRTWRQWFRPRR